MQLDPETAVCRNMAVDAVFDSVSVATTFQATLAKVGVIFCPISEAVREHPDLVKQYLGSVVPAGDNYFAALNSAVLHRWQLRVHSQGRALPDGTVHLLPHQCRNTGQFERTLIIAEDGASRQLSRRLHRADARREPAARRRRRTRRDGRCTRSSTARCRTGIPATRTGKGGIYNFVTKRGACRGARSKISAGPRSRPAPRSPGNTRPASCIGDGSVGEFYSVAVTNNRQQADTGTKMIHIGKQHSHQHHHRPRASAPATPTTPIAAWSACCPRRRTRATSPSATAC